MTCDMALFEFQWINVTLLYTPPPLFSFLFLEVDFPFSSCSKQILISAYAASVL